MFLGQFTGESELSIEALFRQGLVSVSTRSVDLIVARIDRLSQRHLNCLAPAPANRMSSDFQGIASKASPCTDLERQQ